MALFFPGKTECPICSNVLEEHEDVISFPALFHETHKYYFCSDASFHSNCFKEWEYSEPALAILEQYLEYYKNEKPEIPQGMEFSEFEKTKEYLNFMRGMGLLLSKE